MTDNTDLLTKYLAELDDPSTSRAHIESYFAGSYKDFDRSPMAPKELSDRDAHLMFFDALQEGMTDYHHTVHLAEELPSGKIVTYWTFEGTHTGMFFGIPATNRRVRCNGLDIYTLEDGKFTEQRHVEDIAGLMGQLTAP